MRQQGQYNRRIDLLVDATIMGTPVVSFVGISRHNRGGERRTAQ